MVGKNVQHHQTIFHASTCWYLVSKDDLFPVVVKPRIEIKLACIRGHSLRVHGSRKTTWLIYRPASEAACHFLNVFLRVAAVNTQRVKLHQLASVVFVDASLRCFLLSLRRSATSRLLSWELVDAAPTHTTQD